MHQDLQDLLAFWLGDHDPGEARRHALLARLEGDDAFRHSFVDEIRKKSPPPSSIPTTDCLNRSARFTSRKAKRA